LVLILGGRRKMKEAKRNDKPKARRKKERKKERIPG